jgi:hypothetical protein
LNLERMLNTVRFCRAERPAKKKPRIEVGLG